MGYLEVEFGNLMNGASLIAMDTENGYIYEKMVDVKVRFRLAGMILTKSKFFYRLRGNL